MPKKRKTSEPGAKASQRRARVRKVARDTTPRRPDGSEYSFEEKVRHVAQTYCYQHFTPFPGQLELYDAIFNRKCRTVFLQCGRGWSKSFSAAWLTSVWAMFFPNSYCLYLAPLLKQAKKIVWHPKLFEVFIHEALIANKSNQDFAYDLINGSRIEVDGSENFDSQRGLRPNLVVADEFREFSPEWIDVMYPNVGKVNGTIIFLGTPPHFPILADGEPHHYVRWANYCKTEMVDDPGQFFYVHAPTSDNPFYPPDFLKAEKKRLHDLDLQHVWEREYEARVVMGSSRQVFRMFSQKKHVVPHEELAELIRQEPDRFELYCSADPGTSSTFAVLFMALDRQTNTPYWLDEIYEKDTSQTTTRNILPALLKTCWELHPDFGDWNFIADSAAAWFFQEAQDWFVSEEARQWFTHEGIPWWQVVFAPTQKRIGDKEEGIALLKEVFNEREGVMSDRCQFTALEFINYQTNKLGKYVKLNDHNIDNSRYILRESQFAISKEYKPKREKHQDEFGWTSVTADYMEYRKGKDWTYGLF